MNTEERITYAYLMFEFEWRNIGQLITCDEDIWRERFLIPPDVDPLNVHKPYGLTSPQIVNDIWTLGLCLPLLIRPMDDQTDETFVEWIMYWLLHSSIHLIVNGDAVGPVPLEEIERRVRELHEDWLPESFGFGETVKATE